MCFRIILQFIGLIFISAILYPEHSECSDTENKSNDGNSIHKKHMLFSRSSIGNLSSISHKYDERLRELRKYIADMPGENSKEEFSTMQQHTDEQEGSIEIQKKLAEVPEEDDPSMSKENKHQTTEVPEDSSDPLFPNSEYTSADAKHIEIHGYVDLKLLNSALEEIQESENTTSKICHKRGSEKIKTKCQDLSDNTITDTAELFDSTEYFESYPNQMDQQITDASRDVHSDHLEITHTKNIHNDHDKSREYQKNFVVINTQPKKRNITLSDQKTHQDTHDNEHITLLHYTAEVLHFESTEEPPEHNKNPQYHNKVEQDSLENTTTSSKGIFNTLSSMQNGVYSFINTLFEYHQDKQSTEQQEQSQYTNHSWKCDPIGNETMTETPLNSSFGNELPPYIFKVEPENERYTQATAKPTDFSRSCTTPEDEDDSEIKLLQQPGYHVKNEDTEQRIQSKPDTLNESDSDIDVPYQTDSDNTPCYQYPYMSNAFRKKVERIHDNRHLQYMAKENKKGNLYSAPGLRHGCLHGKKDSSPSKQCAMGNKQGVSDSSSLKGGKNGLSKQNDKEFKEMTSDSDKSAFSQKGAIPIDFKEDQYIHDHMHYSTIGNHPMNPHIQGFTSNPVNTDYNNQDYQNDSSASDDVTHSKSNDDLFVDVSEYVIVSDEESIIKEQTLYPQND